MSKGYVSLVLHAHLPFVRHPEHEDFLEERWLFEAISETYLPILAHLLDLLRDGVPFKLTISFSPPLANMLADALLQERYVRYLDKSIELAEKEIDRTTKEGNPAFIELAHFYFDRLTSLRRLYVDRYGCDILRAFKDVAASDNLELMTCAGTHGFMPLMRYHPEAIRAQIMTAVMEHERFFGQAPRGMWLPECGYFPDVDRYLAEAGISYFLTDSHGILNAEPRPVYGVFRPLMTPHGVGVFGRDIESSKQVWSSKEGYPGDADYREFYRDVGFDMPFDYIKDFIHPDGIRLNTGLKYFRITGSDSLSQRAPYNRRQAMEKAAQHAANFMFNRERQIEWLSGTMENKPIIVAPYDAELFGHWWFEGPDWINYLLRKVAYDQGVFAMTTPRHFLQEETWLQVAQPGASSWGDKGYYEVWLNGTNDWIYPHLHKAAERMVELAKHPRRGEPLVDRAVKQAMRELLLLQASDWAFIMTTATAVEYAAKRTEVHTERFNELYRQVMEGTINEAFLRDIESKDNIFPFADPDLYVPIRE